MSIRLMSKVWGLAVDSDTRDILMALADHADDDGNGVRPSIGRLAWKIGTGIKNKNGEYPQERTVQRRIKELLKIRALKLVRKSGFKRANEYHIDLSVFPEKPEFQEKGDNLSLLEKGDNLLEKGDKKASKGDTTLSPESSIESSIESLDNDLFSGVKSPLSPSPRTKEQIKEGIRNAITDYAKSGGKKRGVADPHLAQTDRVGTIAKSLIALMGYESSSIYKEANTLANKEYGEEWITRQIEVLSKTNEFSKPEASVFWVHGKLEDAWAKQTAQEEKIWDFSN